MIDYFYKFSDHYSMIISLELLGITYVDDKNIKHVIQGSHQYALCEVGEIPGKEGYHINLRVLDPNFDTSSLIPYQVFPTNPVCVWA